MVKKKQEALLERGLAELQRQGIAVDQPAPQSVERLLAAAGKGREQDLAIAHLLGSIADRAAWEALRRLEETAEDKELRREIRRSFYRLEQKGVAGERPREEEAGRPSFSLAPELEGYLSAVDGSGAKMAWLVRPQTGGLMLLYGLVSDREGMLEVGAARTSRKALREMIAESKQARGITIFRVPWQYADYVLYEGFEIARGSGREGIQQYPSLRGAFTTRAPESMVHPIYDRLEPAEVTEGAWRSRSRELLSEPELASWVLEREWIEPYLKRLEEAQESRLVLNQAQREERLAGIVHDAVREIFAGERGDLIRRRLEDMALCFIETERREQAGLALAVALALKEGDAGGLGALDITFLSALVRKSLSAYLREEKRKEAEDPRLIVKP